MSFDMSGRLAATARSALSPVDRMSAYQGVCAELVLTDISEGCDLEK